MPSPNRWTLIAIILGSSMTFIDATVVNVRCRHSKLTCRPPLPTCNGTSRPTGCSWGSWSRAIAVFGVMLARTFELRVRSRLDSLALSPAAREGIERDLPKMAGADIAQVPSLPPQEQPVVRAIIDGGFVSAFRLVMIGAAGLALAAASFGNAIRP